MAMSIHASTWDDWTDEPAPARGVASARTEGAPHGVRGHSVHFHLKRLGWLLRVHGEPLVKRALDVTAVLIGTPFAGFVMLIAGLLIKLTDGGPMLYWQRRVGRHGRLFDFPKLRSMVVNAEALRADLGAKNDHRTGVTFKMRDDPRVTWIGRLIRRWSIDELPQIWCVLVGDMSLVGPRPALPSEVSCYSAADRRRLDVTPGLTCLWQIRGRAEIPFDEQVVLDVSYIQERSLTLDVRILLLTVPAVLTGRGAY